TDRITGGGICPLLFSASNPRQSVKGGRFSSSQEIELDDSFDIPIRLFEQAHSGSLAFCECQGENIFEPIGTGNFPHLVICRESGMPLGWGCGEKMSTNRSRIRFAPSILRECTIRLPKL